MKPYSLFLIGIIYIFSGCSVGYQDFVDMENDMIGGKLMNYKPYKYKDAGKLIRADFLVQGEGLTHITKDEDGNLVHHYFLDEVLSNFRGNKKWIGKCLIYKVIDSKTKVVTGWGFDKGGNPLSCRTW